MANSSRKRKRRKLVTEDLDGYSISDVIVALNSDRYSDKIRNATPGPSEDSLIFMFHDGREAHFKFQEDAQGDIHVRLRNTGPRTGNEYVAQDSAENTADDLLHIAETAPLPVVDRDMRRGVLGGLR